MLLGLALLPFERRVSGIGNAKGCGIGSIGMTRGLAQLHRFHRYTGGSGIALPLGPLNAKGSGIGYAGGSGIDSVGMQGGLA